MPKKYRVVVTRAAECDIDGIFEYIAHSSRDAAILWLERIEERIDSLEQFPRRCRNVPEAEGLDGEYREALYGDYRAIFCIDGSLVIGLRVIHSSRLLDIGAFTE